jgi:hypothetical protein
LTAEVGPVILNLLYAVQQLLERFPLVRVTSPKSQPCAALVSSEGTAKMNPYRIAAVATTISKTTEVIIQGPGVKAGGSHREFRSKPEAQDFVDAMNFSFDEGFKEGTGGSLPLCREDSAFNGVPASMCLRCGMTGRHPSPMDCITELRDQLAVTQFKLAACITEIAQSRGAPRETEGHYHPRG